MKRVILLSLLFLSQAFAASSFEKELKELGEITEEGVSLLDQIYGMLKGFGLIIDVHEIANELKEQGKSFDESSVLRQVLILVVAFWLIYETIFGSPLFDIFLAYLTVAFLLNWVSPAIAANAYDFFSKIFVGAFAYLFLEFILRFVYFLSSTTKKFMQVTMALLFVGFMNFEAFRKLAMSLIETISGPLGFLGFLVFLGFFRLSFLFLGLVSAPETKGLRSRGTILWQEAMKTRKILEEQALERIKTR